ncbi:LysR family transcriptional regulator [Alloscardovia theropitheci]|uniref:LysR family transcriptional regulator n=1 Tax=Alloscardovia theropitheci TaxID=2496842 RepID=A0A4R0QVS5_9BIFI|nr:LysR family transcriptional regulator [Alloscardovia theropitheci]TCD54367.1 LysR family transcriptional regulator [Alloscardovia theropitheci]
MASIDDLEQLLVVARKGTLSAAARELHTSQPSLTRTMQRLEAEFKVSLFDRTSGSVTLNSTGDLAVERARSVVDSYNLMLEDIRKHDAQQKSISITSCAPVPLSVISSIVRRIFPNFSITQSIEPQLDAITDALSSNDAQLTITPHPITGNNTLTVPFMQESLYLAVPTNHILARYDELRFSDFNGYNIVMHPDVGFWISVCREHLPASQLLVQQSDEAFRTVVENSEILYFVTQEARKIAYNRLLRTDSERKFIRILDTDATATFYCSCNTSFNPALKDFVQQLPMLRIDD